MEPANNSIIIQAQKTPSQRSHWEFYAGLCMAQSDLEAPACITSPERLDALCGMHDVTDKKDEATRMVAYL